MAREEELFDEEAGELGGVMTDDAMFLDEIAGEELDAETGDLLRIEANLLGAFGAITSCDFRGNGLAVGDDVVDEIFPDVILNGADMLAERVLRSFTGLRHEIGDIDARGPGMSDGAGDLGDEEIRKNAGVERAGPHEDEVGVVDGFEGGGERAYAAGNELEFANRNSAAGNVGFALYALAIGEGSDEMNVRSGGRKDATADRKNFGGNANRFSEISGNVGKRRKEEIAKVVTAEAAPGLESILKKTAEERFVFGERHHAIANIARRKNAVFTAQTAGAAAVVGDGNDGGEIGDRASEGGLFVAPPDDMVLQTTKKSGKPGAAAESDNTKGTGGPLGLTRLFHENECR